MEQFTINASNIKCGGCASNIQQGLKEISGIESIEVNIETGEVNITANGVEKTVIEQKLSDLGFPAK